MKRGNLVEFKPMFGIQSPENLGIFLERITKKKVVHIQVYTLKGVREFKAAHLTKRKFDYKMDISRSLAGKKMDSLLRPVLQDLIKKHGQKQSAKGLTNRKKSKDLVEKIQPPSTEHELWRLIVKDLCDVTIADMTERWFGEKDPSIKQLDVIEDLLENSKQNGVGYFDYISPKEKLFRPLEPSKYDEIRGEIQQLERLRGRLVEIEEYEDEEGYIQTKLIPVGLKYATLSEEDWLVVNKIQLWMADLVTHKKITKEGLAGTTIHTIDKFTLSQYLRFLAEDWTESRDLLQPASAMVEFLLRTEHWSESEALEAVAIRAVLENQNFSWEVDPDVQEIAKSIPETQDEPEAYQGRKDLRDLVSYTVDPATARDFDQALSYNKETDGSYSFWVHIADVTHYVTPGSILDDYAKQ
ncbi:MAG: RNB domain-containing ribonuclease, partial [Candidatus Hodarchaeales archaeon]